jgi:hypothetical protein
LLIHGPAKFFAQECFFAQRLTITVGNRESHDTYFFRSHVVFDGALAGGLCWDKNKIGAVVKPERMRSDHVGDNVDERRTVLSQCFEGE